MGDAKRLVLDSCEEFRSAEAGKTKFGFWRQITTSSLEDFLGNQKLKEPDSCKTTKVIMSERSKDAGKSFNDNCADLLDILFMK